VYHKKEFFIMKNTKILLAILAVALVFGMTACNNGSTGTKKPATSTNPPTTDPAPDSIEGIWKDNTNTATFTETDWNLVMGSSGNIMGTYTYSSSNGKATLSENTYISGGTATVSGNSMTIVVNWKGSGSMGASSQSFGPLTKQ
jgi:hypothetical protein